MTRKKREKKRKNHKRKWRENLRNASWKNLIITIIATVIVIIIIDFFSTNLPRIENGYYPIRISQKGLRISAPGIAIVKNGKIRYFTVAHWFPIGVNNYFSLRLKGQLHQINEVQYLGSDIAEIFTGKSKIIIGCTDSQPGVVQWTRSRFIRRYEPLLLTSLIDNSTYLFQFDIVAQLENETRTGLAMFSEKEMSNEGDSGTPLIDKEGNIYFLSSSGYYKPWKKYITSIVRLRY